MKSPTCHLLVLVIDIDVHQGVHYVPRTNDEPKLTPPPLTSTKYFQNFQGKNEFLLEWGWGIKALVTGLKILFMQLPLLKP